MNLTAALVTIAIFGLVSLAIASWPDRSCGRAPSKVGDALAIALRDHYLEHGTTEEVLGYVKRVHPSGSVRVELVLASDAVEEANRILHTESGTA